MALRSESDILGMGEWDSVVAILCAAPSAAPLEDLMVRSGAQRRVSNHGLGHQSGDASRHPKRKAPARLPGGRNSNCGFSPIPLWRGCQKTVCQDFCSSRFPHEMAE